MDDVCTQKDKSNIYELLTALTLGMWMKPEWSDNVEGRGKGLVLDFHDAKSLACFNSKLEALSGKHPLRVVPMQCRVIGAPSHALA
jgi:hypothetical protein